MSLLPSANQPPTWPPSPFPAAIWSLLPPLTSSLMPSRTSPVLQLLPATRSPNLKPWRALLRLPPLLVELQLLQPLLLLQKKRKSRHLSKRTSTWEAYSETMEIIETPVSFRIKRTALNWKFGVFKAEASRHGLPICLCRSHLQPLRELFYLKKWEIEFEPGFRYVC